MAPSSYPTEIDALTALDDDELTDRYGVVVDWRACEDEMVADFGRHLAAGDSLGVRLDDSELYVTYAGTEHHLPLTQTPADRYVAICSLVSILGPRYELRRLKSSVRSDTHVFLLLLADDWHRLHKHHRAWVDRLFERVPLGEDGFGGGEVPYIEVQRPQVERKPWWRFWR